MSINIKNIKTKEELKNLFLQILDHIEKNMDKEQYLNMIFYGSYSWSFYRMFENLEIAVVSDMEFRECLLFLVYLILETSVPFSLAIKLLEESENTNCEINDVIRIYSNYYIQDDNIRIRRFYIGKINDIELYDVKRIRECIEEML